MNRKNDCTVQWHLFKLDLDMKLLETPFAAVSVRFLLENNVGGRKRVT